MNHSAAQHARGEGRYLALSRLFLELQNVNNLALALLPQHLVRHRDFFAPAPARSARVAAAHVMYKLHQRACKDY